MVKVGRVKWIELPSWFERTIGMVEWVGEVDEVVVAVVVVVVVVELWFWDPLCFLITVNPLWIAMLAYGAWFDNSIS